MKRGLAIFSAIVGGLILAVILLIAFGFSNLDSIVEEAVEKVGSRVAQVDVELDKASISVTEGTGALMGLSVDNPKGFHTDSAMRLGEIKVSISEKSDLETVIIKEVLISAPEVTYEVGSDGSNIDAIQKNVDAFVAKHAGGKSEPAPSKGEGPKLIIENLKVQKGVVNVSATLLKGKKLSAPLPDIHLKDIGKKEGGVGPAKIASDLIAAITKKTGDAVGTLGLDKLLGDAGAAVSEAASDAGKKVKEGVSGATDDVKKGVEDVGSSVKKLFGE